MKKTIHIVTIGYHIKHILATAKIYPTDKVFLLYMFRGEKRPEKMKKALNEARKFLITQGISIQAIQINTIEDVKKVFEKAKKHNIVVNLTGGRKLLSFWTYIFALINYKHVKKIIYVDEDGKIINFPLFIHPFNLSNLEKKILMKKKEKLSELVDEIGIKKPPLYSYLKKLYAKGVIDYRSGVIKRKCGVIIDDDVYSFVGCE